MRDRFLYILLSVKQYLRTFLGKKSYAQFGEDITLLKLFPGEYHGFYVDIGSYHPIHYSNTYLLYRNGWHGVNVDANPESVRLLKLFRRRDKTVHAGIGRTRGNAHFYVMNHRAMSTLSEATRDAYLKKKFVRLVRVINIPVLTLSDIFSEHVPSDTTIDFLNIDIEGFAGEALAGNDWTRFVPRIIAVEADEFDRVHPEENAEYTLLTSKGYELRDVCGLTQIYAKKGA